MNDRSIVWTHIIKDLGFIFDNQLNFNLQIDTVCSKASRLLGIIFRSTGKFPDYHRFIHLYKSLVLPIVLYASQILSPHKLQDINSIESIQHYFVRILSRRMGNPMHPFNHNYLAISKRFNIHSLDEVRACFDVTFVFSILHHKIKCPNFEKIIKYRDLSHLFRNPRVLREYRYKGNYSFESAIPRLVCLYNLLYAILISLRYLKKMPKNILFLIIISLTTK